jgi:5-carboxymethyl-2-hydroxymuconate isomerase
MPHVTLEHTDNLDSPPDFDELFARVHAVLAEVGGIRMDNCKSRAIRLDRYFVGDGSGIQRFVHLDVRFLEGREIAIKQEIGRRLLSILKERFAAALKAHDVQITVEIRDIERSMYFKIPEGTIPS